MISVKRLNSEPRAMPISWLFVVLAAFLLWVVPSTDSIYHREGEDMVAQSHDVRLGLLFHSRILAARSEAGAGWNWDVDVDGRALLLSLLLTLPVAWLGRSSWRRWHEEPPAT